MPLFDFVCNACGENFEFLVMGSDRPYCPRCASGDLKKKISAFAFRSKGEGSKTVSSGGSSCAGCRGGNCSSC